jgi:hypothetical protein
MSFVKIGVTGRYTLLKIVNEFLSVRSTILVNRSAHNTIQYVNVS